MPNRLILFQCAYICVLCMGSSIIAIFLYNLRIIIITLFISLIKVLQNLNFEVKIKTSKLKHGILRLCFRYQRKCDELEVGNGQFNEKFVQLETDKKEVVGFWKRQVETKSKSSF